MKIKKFAVIGRPVGHSKSPDLFRILAEKFNVAGLYTRIVSKNVEEALQLISELDIDGFNATMPYKKELISRVDKISCEAGEVEAVNTVIKNKNRLIGYNTDPQGVIMPLKRRGLLLHNLRLLIMGAGGAAEAVLYALSGKVRSITVSNRTKKRAMDLTGRFEFVYLPWADLSASIKEFDLIINTMPIRFPLELQTGQIVFNADYQSNEALEFVDRSVIVIPGEEWLIGQALESFSHFYDRMKVNDKGIEDILPAIKSSNKSSICIIGFMGAGKSTIAEKLAKRMGYQWIDSDKMIEKKENMSVENIFRSKGEKYFRKCETEIMTRNIKKNAVISFGGGIVEDSKNRKFMRKNFKIIWLHTPLSVCLERLALNDRPLLNVQDKVKEAKMIFKRRKDRYFAVSDLIVRGDRSVEVIVERIYEEVG
jgi:shikimate dehydrogenase